MIQNLWKRIGSAIVITAVGVGIFFGLQLPRQQFGAIPVVVSLFETSLASSIATTDTSMTLVTGTDRAGTTLSGYMCFTLDSGTSSAEFVCGTVAGTAVSSMTRGIDPQNPGTSVTALKFAHRRAADVKQTDYPQLAILSRIIAGTDTFPSLLHYASTVCSVGSTNASICDKAYIDGVAVAGASNANTTTKGIVEEATQAEVDARSTVGGTGADLYARPDAFRTVLTHDYAASSGGTDTYAITLTPAVTAYATGDIYTFKADVANTGAATLNVNSLGAKSLKVFSNLDPQDGYIKASSIVTVAYDGTNLQVLSVSGKPFVSQSGEEVYGVDAVGTDAYAITLAPIPAAYVTGMTVRFKAGTLNTGTASLNVNSLGAKTIKRYFRGALNTLATNDILSGQVVTVTYESSADAFIMQSPSANTPLQIQSAGATTHDISSTTTQNIAHGLGVAPKKIKITATYFLAGAVSASSVGTYDGTNTATVFVTQNAGTGSDAGNSTTYVLQIESGSSAAMEQATVTVDATNIILAYTKSGSPTGTINILWEAED